MEANHETAQYGLEIHLNALKVICTYYLVFQRVDNYMQSIGYYLDKIFAMYSQTCSMVFLF